MAYIFSRAFYNWHLYLIFSFFFQGVHSARLLYGALEVGKRMTVSSRHEIDWIRKLTFRNGIDIGYLSEHSIRMFWYLSTCVVVRMWYIRISFYSILHTIWFLENESFHEEYGHLIVFGLSFFSYFEFYSYIRQVI